MTSVSRNTGKSKGAVKKLPRIETLSETQVVDITQKHLLVSALKNGKTMKEAYQIIKRQFPDFKRSRRWGQKVYAEYKQHGVIAYVDGRVSNQNQKKALTPAIERIILSWWYARPGVDYREIWRNEMVKFLVLPQIWGKKCGFSQTSIHRQFAYNFLLKQTDFCLFYDPQTTRARSKSKFARPYICRLRNFSRLTCPSVCP